MEADFASVWSRVTGAAPGQNEQTSLKRWIRSEEEAGALCLGLSGCRASSPLREAFQSFGRDARRHLRALRAMYYLRTGERCPAAVKPPTAGQPSLRDLRAYYLSALERAQDYRRSAETAQADLAALCRRLAKEEETHAETARLLAERLL
ncbi:MAG: hypothetical protein IKD79_01980 [Oscillospiraceae bacterium]|nr:hypothetical protein [Oscillospiraceae bacterium]